MSRFILTCPGDPDGGQCPFTADGATLSSARRTLRGHALRSHGLVFDREDKLLRRVSPEELAERRLAFRRVQLSATDRRRLDQQLVQGLLAEFGVDDTAACTVSGLPAGDSCLSGESFASGPLPDLSAGVSPPAIVADAGTYVAAAVVSMVVEDPVFTPPRGYSPTRMVDFLMENLGRRPESLGTLLGSSDPSSSYWLEVAAGLQRTIGRQLMDEVLDLMSADPSGQRAFEAALDRLARLARRPLDEDY